MPGFEMPVAPMEKKQSELSDEDKRVMSRRNFLKAAGAMAVSAAAPEVMAAPEQKKDDVSMNFELTPMQRELLVKDLERRAPGARAEFTLSDPRGELAQSHRGRGMSDRFQSREGSERPMGPGVGQMGGARQTRGERYNSPVGRGSSGGQIDTMIMQVHVIVALPDGTEKRGRGVAFYPPKEGFTLDRMARQALEEAFKE